MLSSPGLSLTVSRTTAERGTSQVKTSVRSAPLARAVPVQTQPKTGAAAASPVQEVKQEPEQNKGQALKFATFALAATKIAANVALAVASPAPAVAAGIAGVAALAGAASQALTR
jgi:hypothetical protein